MKKLNYLYLSRRNLLMLLAKLDRNAAGGNSACTVVKFRNPADPFVQTMDEVHVVAVEDERYYAKRSAGAMHPADEIAVASKIYGDQLQDVDLTQDGIPSAECCCQKL